MNFTMEQMALAKKAASPEELIALAAEKGITLGAEEAKTCFDKLHKEGALADEELDNVSGGGWLCGDGTPNPDEVSATYLRCDSKFCHFHFEQSVVLSKYFAPGDSCPCDKCGEGTLRPYAWRLKDGTVQNLPD